MNILSGFSSQLTSTIKNDLFKYRFDVFVKTLGWNLNTPNGIEVDQFDHDETLYVVAKDNFGDIMGCARLLPTTKPYLLEVVFPELLNGLDVPKSSDIWEISRFTNVQPGESTNNSAIGNNGQISELSFSNLLHSAIACAKAQGAKRLISVSPVGIERLLRKVGIKAYRAGPPKIIDGHAILACWIDIE